MTSLANPPKLNLNMAYEKVGEYGCAQWLLTFVVCIARNANNYIYYPYAYLVLEQHYLCENESGEFLSCTREEICEGENLPNYKVDTSYEYYLDNWFVQMNLVCTPVATIGLMVTLYFIGFACGGMLYALPDKLGRKNALLIGCLLAAIGQTISIFVPTIRARCLAFFLMGLAQVKAGTSYVWLSECTSLPYKSRAFTYINLFDAIPMALVGIYYIYLTKNWEWICLAMMILTYVAILMIYFCPESPRWHLINGRTPEAIVSLNYIAKMNGKEARIPTNAIFVEDPTNFINSALFTQ